MADDDTPRRAQAQVLPARKPARDVRDRLEREYLDVYGSLDGTAKRLDAMRAKYDEFVAARVKELDEELGRADRLSRDHRVG